MTENKAIEAIQALETVQKYKDLESELSKRNLTIDHIREYIQFEDECVKQGFTFKSLLEAREKQSGKKPMLSMHEIGCMAIDYADGHGEIKRTESNFWRCPKCKSVVGERKNIVKIAVRESTGRKLRMSDEWKAVLTVIVLIVALVIESRCDSEY